MAVACITLLAPLSVRAAYRVGPGDVLEVAIAPDAKLSGKYAVDEEGAIELEELGELKVAGKTPEEIDDQLTLALKKFYKAPSVRLAVFEYKSQKVYLLGAIAKPGNYVLQGEKTLLDAVLEAGGTTPASLGKILVLRAGSAALEPETVTIELEKLLSGGPAGSSNLSLRSGDMVIVAGSEGLTAAGGIVDATTASVTVVGEVARPGVFRLEPGATALAAVLAAGGITKYSAPNRSTVVRVRESGRKVIAFELGDIMKHGDKDKDVGLEPGDMVIVPARWF